MRNLEIKCDFCHKNIYCKVHKVTLAGTVFTKVKYFAYGNIEYELCDVCFEKIGKAVDKIKEESK